MLDLITIGDATLDTFVVLDDKAARVQCSVNKTNCQLSLNYADKIPIKTSIQSVGGNAANVAVACKKLGFDTSIVTELGDDIVGTVIHGELEHAGVDGSHIRTLKGKETRYAVVLNYKGERTILSYHADRSYVFPKLKTSRWVYYTSLGPTFEKLQTKLITHIKKHPQTKLAMNPGSFQLKKGLRHTKKILPLLDLLFVNKEEATILTGKKQSITDDLKALYEKGIRQIVITDGTKGSYTYDGETIWFMKPYPIKAKARTGAGDAYASGFLSAIMAEKDATDALRWGSANASGVILELGAQNGQLTRRQALSLVKKYPSVQPKKVL